MRDLMAMVFLLVILTLTGCGSRSQTQIVADIRAEAQAYQVASTPAIAKAIADALAADVIAATAQIPDLPTPTHAVHEIIADPAIMEDPAKDAQADPPPYVPPTVVTPDPTPALFVEFGTWVLRLGMAGITLSILAFAVSKWVPVLGAFTSIIEEVFILSALGCLIGVGLIWTGRNTWVLYLTIAGFVALQVYNYRAAWLPLFRTTNIKGT